MSGYKTFHDLDILTAADVNGYLMSQTVPRFTSSAARDIAIPAPSTGMFAYIIGSGLTYYVGSAWTAFNPAPPVGATPGMMATPIQTGSAGPATVTLNVQVFDNVLGYYAFTAPGSRRCRVTFAGGIMSAAAGTLGQVAVRDGGTSNPTNASTPICYTQAYISASGGPGQIGVDFSKTWVPDAGVHRLGVFYSHGIGSGASLIGSRELYVEDVG